MIVNTRYRISYINSFSDDVDEQTVAYSDGRRFAIMLARAYSMTTYSLVFFGSTSSTTPEKIFFAGKDVQMITDGDDVRYVALVGKTVKVLKEFDDGFYLADQ